MFSKFDNTNLYTCETCGKSFQNKNKFFSVVKQTYEDKGDYVPRTNTVCHDLGNFYKIVCEKNVF